MKTLLYLLTIFALFSSCRKEEDDDDHKINTYTIEGRYLKNCSTAWSGVNLRFHTLRKYTFSVKKSYVAEVTTDENGYYKADYRDENEFKLGSDGGIGIEYTVPGDPSSYYPLVDNIRMHQNLTLDWVTRPNDTAFFRTIGGWNLTSADTLYFEHETPRLKYVIGPIDDNYPFETLIYQSNSGRKSFDWSIGIKNTKKMREDNSNFGNFGNSGYERNICSSTEIIIDLTKFKK
jgi:hypothetical protein